MKAKKRTIGRHIVSDPAICHGKMTFRGTRIFVADVLEQVAMGLDWDVVIADWHGSISREAIAEAVRLAGEAFATHANQIGLQVATR